MISTEEEIGDTSSFVEQVLSAEEGELEIDEEVQERLVLLGSPFVPNFDALGRKGVQCVQRALEQLSGEVIAGTEPVFDTDDEGEDTFVDVVGGEQRDGSAEFDGSRSRTP